MSDPRSDSRRSEILNVGFAFTTHFHAFSTETFDSTKSRSGQSLSCPAGKQVLRNTLSCHNLQVASDTLEMILQSISASLHSSDTKELDGVGMTCDKRQWPHPSQCSFSFLCDGTEVAAWTEGRYS